MVYDIRTHKQVQIPSIEGQTAPNLDAPIIHGIRSIQINPSQSMLATSAKNYNDICVYRLPTLDPLCIGEVISHNLLFKNIC